MAFHTFVMSRITNDVGLLVYRLFSFPVCWLAASPQFSQRLSEALSNWYNGNKSGVGNFINNKQQKMRPSALLFQMALETCIYSLDSQLNSDSSLLADTHKIHTYRVSHGCSPSGRYFQKF